MKYLVILSIFVLADVGCTPSDGRSASDPGSSIAATAPKNGLSFEQIATPAQEGSSTPTMHTTSEGDVLLSWVEPGDEGGYVLRFAQLEDGHWSNPKTVAGGEHWFINWADFPSVISLGGTKMAAHFLARSGKGTYAYDVYVTQSADGGDTWTEPVAPHRDGTQTEHGFVSMLAMPDGSLFAAWLDGRNTAGHGNHGQESGGAMTLRTAILDADGRPSNEALLDNRICDCCQTSAATTANGLLVAYRDRTEEEVRDISVVRLEDEVWSEPRTVHADGWEINGCPVNGPSVVADGEMVAVAWFTAAGGTPRVNVAFSSDEGQSFADPIQVDDGQPLGRVHAVMLPDGSAIVSWIESLASGAEIRVRLVHADGTTEESRTVNTTANSRASGFPRMTRNGNMLYMAWTDAGDPTMIRTAMTTFPG